MPLRTQKWIERRDLKDNPDTLYIFGDNLERRGKGGQAKAMRGEPNAVGIPTKKRPSLEEGSFFTDDDYEANKAAILQSVERVVEALKEGKDVVIPEDGLGTDRAQLRHRAPRTFDFLQRVIGRLHEIGQENTLQTKP